MKLNCGNKEKTTTTPKQHSERANRGYFIIFNTKGDGLVLSAVVKTEQSLTESLFYRKGNRAGAGAGRSRG